jgi:hypothetical protein
VLRDLRFPLSLLPFCLGFPYRDQFAHEGFQGQTSQEFLLLWIECQHGVQTEADVFPAIAHRSPSFERLMRAEIELGCVCQQQRSLPLSCFVIDLTPMGGQNIPITDGGKAQQAVCRLRLPQLESACGKEAEGLAAKETDYIFLLPVAKKLRQPSFAEIN